MPRPKEEFDRLFEIAEREAYERGFRDAIKKLADQATAEMNPNQMAEPADIRTDFEKVVDTAAAQVMPAPERPRGRPAWAQGLVRDAVIEKPGLKGVEIVRAITAKGTEIRERTVRTCLRRLKGKEIRQRKGKWYPIPKDKQPTKEENQLALNVNGEVPTTPPH